MKTNTERILPDTFYHVYNRGINGETLFKEERNYDYFLQRYGTFIPPVANTFAYCLLGNHFHLLIRTKTEKEISEWAKREDREQSKNLADKDASWHISKQFATLFKSYALAINKGYNRTGGLFEEPFRRLEVTSEHHFSQLVYYIHVNPQKHGFCSDFRDYPHSSYGSHLSQVSTKLKREEVLEWFGGVNQFREFHTQSNDLESIKEFLIELD